MLCQAAALSPLLSTLLAFSNLERYLLPTLPTSFFSLSFFLFPWRLSVALTSHGSLRVCFFLFFHFCTCSWEATQRIHLFGLDTLKCNLCKVSTIRFMYSFFFSSDWCLWFQREKVFCRATYNRCADEVQPEFSQWADSTINCLSCFIWCL